MELQLGLAVRKKKFAGFKGSRKVLDTMDPSKEARSGKKDNSIPLEKLSHETGNCAITVRVSRLWEAYNLKNNRDLISIEMVLIDAEGSYIRGSIKGNYAHVFQNRIVEGGIYCIKNFEVVDNKTNYRVVAENKLMIQFYANSSVTLGLDLAAPDVVGPICSEGDVTNKNDHGRIVKCLMLELQDMTTAKLRLTLWDKSVDEYIQHKSTVKGHVIVGVFTSNLVKKYFNTLTLSSTTASKVYLDLEIEEVATIKKKYGSLCDSNNITPLKLQTQEVDTAAIVSQLKTITDILKIAKTDFKDFREIGANCC